MPTLVKKSSGDLEKLINELLKDRPDKEKVKVLMAKSGIPYTQDPIEQMSAVLNLLGKTSSKKFSEKVQDL